MDKSKSETLIDESREIAETIRGTHPLLAKWIEKLTEEYAIAVKLGLKAEETIHYLTK